MAKPAEDPVQCTEKLRQFKELLSQGSRRLAAVKEMGQTSDKENPTIFYKSRFI